MIKIVSAQHLIPVEGEILSPGALAIHGDRILEVGPPSELKNKFPSAAVEDFRGKTLLPGLVNAHADLATTEYWQFPHEPFETAEGTVLFSRWVINVSRFKSALSLSDQQNSIKNGLQRSLRSGVTTLGDTCRFPISISLYEKSLLRVVGLAEVENIQRKMAQEDFEQSLALVDEIQHGSNPKITAGLAPFSAYTLSKNLLRILASHVQQLQIPLHLHAALSFSEMEFFYDSLGEISSVLFKEAGWEEKIPPPHHMTPIQFLHEIGFLKARPAIVGCLHLGPTDAALLDHAGCTRIYAPMAFQFLKMGKIPWPKIFKEKIGWALGTLGKAAGTSLNLWEEMRTILDQVDPEHRPSAAEEILKAATLGSAKALRLESQIGSFAKNKLADLIVIDTPEGPGPLISRILEQTEEGHLVASAVGGEWVFHR